jgi:hypothetical protein
VAAFSGEQQQRADHDDYAGHELQVTHISIAEQSQTNRKSGKARRAQQCEMRLGLLTSCVGRNDRSVHSIDDCAYSICR